MDGSCGDGMDGLDGGINGFDGDGDASLGAVGTGNGIISR